MGMQVERYYQAMEEQYAADHPVASKWTKADLVVSSPKIERWKLRLSAPPWLRELSWTTLPVVLGGVLASGITAFIVLMWNRL